MKKLIKVSQKRWDSIPDDYKGIWQAPFGQHMDWLGCKVVLSGCITGEVGCKLLVEGIDFEIE